MQLQKFIMQTRLRPMRRPGRIVRIDDQRRLPVGPRASAP